MPLHLLPTLLLYMLLIGYSPGPANIYSLSCAMKYGRKQALVMWRGLFLGFCTTAFTTALLACFVGAEIGGYVVGLKYVGALFILWLAYKIWKTPAEANTKPVECNFSSGYVVQLVNAKMIIFQLMVYSTFVLPYTDKLSSVLLIAALLLLAGPCANLTWLLAGGWLSRFFIMEKKRLNLIMAVALGVCAIIILL